MELKVAQILSPTAIVLGGGSREGVEIGMEFVIYELGDPVLDPETRELLGRLEIIKGRVQVTHVQERLSTAKTVKHTVKKRRTVPLFPIPTMFREEVQEIDVIEKLSVEKMDAGYERRLIVRVGDRARSV